MNDNKFWERVDALMEKQGETKPSLAKKIGKPHTTVYTWFQKGNIPPGDTCYKIADVLGVPLAYLVFGVHGDDNSSSIGDILNESDSEVRKRFKKFINESSDESLQKIWDYFELMWGVKK